MVNLAFNILNKSSVNDLTNSGVFADSANRAFEMLYPAAISSNAWRFATKIQLLNVLPEAPPIPNWRYQMQIPSDYLAAVRVYPRVTFQIYSNNIIYSNTQNMQLEYRFLPDPSFCPAYFVNFFALDMAWWFASAVAQQPALASYLQSQRDSSLQVALFTDSQSHPNDAMTLNPIIQQRYGGWYGQYDIPPAGNP